MIPKTAISLNKRFRTKNGTNVVITQENISDWVRNNDRLEGIPLTEDFLLKNGCEKDGAYDNIYHLTQNTKLAMRYSENSLPYFMVLCQNQHFKNIQFVNEFQELILTLIPLAANTVKG